MDEILEVNLNRRFKFKVGDKVTFSLPGGKVYGEITKAFACTDCGRFVGNYYAANYQFRDVKSSISCYHESNFTRINNV